MNDPIHLRIIAGIIMACGMIGSITIAQGEWWGYWFFLSGSSLGIYWCYQKRTFTLMALDIWYTVANVVGIANHIFNIGGSV